MPEANNTAFIDPTKRKRWMQDFFNSADPVGGTAQYLMNLATLPQPAAEPEPITVSGSDVVGLAPEQTDRLLSRVQQQSQFEAQMARDQNARRERAIEGLNTHVFRVRDLQARKKEQEQAREDAARKPQYITGPGGQITELTPAYGGNPATTREVQAATTRTAPKYVTVPGPNGQPIYRVATPEELQQGVQLYEKPTGSSNMQIRDYTVFQNGQNVRMRDVIDPSTGNTIRTETLGPGYNAGGQGGMTLYQQESLRQRGLATADKMVATLGSSGGVDPNVRQVIGDILHNSGYDDAFINAYLNERVTVDNSWIPGYHGAQDPYVSQQPTQQPGAAAQGAAPAQSTAPGQDIMYDGKPAWLLPDGRVMLK